MIQGAAEGLALVRTHLKNDPLFGGRTVEVYLEQVASFHTRKVRGIYEQVCLTEVRIVRLLQPGIAGTYNVIAGS